MKLQEFVKETLREIIAGVQEAQTYAATTGARINPDEDHARANTSYIDTSDGGIAPIKEIDFDVAVTSTDTTEAQAGAGIFVAALGIGAKGKSDTLNSCVSRIKFSVPIALPVQGKKRA
jgi:hypothetical protein